MHTTRATRSRTPPIDSAACSSTRSVDWQIGNRGDRTAAGHWHDRIIVRNLDSGRVVADVDVPYDSSDPANGAITTAQWAELFYRAIYRLSSSAKFVDGRAAVLSAASALSFTDAQEAAIAAAFDSVGIRAGATTSTIAV